MAAPTQEYPPWLTPIPSVITNADGVPISTSTTIMFLPLTYYGPSIPLGPDWTYGGLTSPASTSTTATPTASTSLPITTALPPTTSTTSPSIISSSSTSSASLVTSSSPTASSSSTSSHVGQPTPTHTNASSGGVGRLTRGQLVGVIVASILGFIFLLVLLLAIYLFCKGRRRRQSRVAGTPMDDDYQFVEGSPRHSGEEADPFLSRRGAPGGGGNGTVQRNIGTGGATQYTEMGARPPPKNVPRVPPPPTTTVVSQGSSNSSSTNSGYGEPLARPTLGIRPIREEHEQEMTGGMILTPEELQRIDQETVLPPENHQEQNGNYTGAYAYRVEVPETPPLPPPKLVDPATSRKSVEFTLPRPFSGGRPSMASQRSSGLPVDADENATLLTAKRVKVENLAPRSPATDEANTSKPSASSFLGSLGAIAGRLSWRKSDSPRSSQHQPLLQSTPLSDQDLEQGRVLRPPPRIPQMSESTSSRGASVGLGEDGSRPISSVSGKSQNSGGTIYHDALSSPATPATPATPSLTPLPRAATPSDVPPTPPPLAPTSGIRSRPSVPSQLSQSQTADEGNTHDNQPSTSQTGSLSGTNYAQNLLPNIDILDLPAPSALSTFGSGSNPSFTTSDITIVDRDHTTRPSIQTKHSLLPTFGLIPTPKVWSEMSNADTASPGSYGVDQDNDIGADYTIDVLEDEPPAAGEGWRSMAAAISSSGGTGGERLARRTTFGVPQYVHQPDFTSEQGSLHSMRSHVSPASPPRSTGSAAASGRRDLSYGSGSSRPSAYSGGRSAGTDQSAALSYSQSLARSGSITSDGRRRGHGPISPALSVFGNSVRSGSGSEFVATTSREGSGSGSGNGDVVGEGGVMLQSPSTAYLGSQRVGSDGAPTMSSPLLHPRNMP